MKKLFTVFAILGMLSSGVRMQAQDFPGDPGTLTVTLTLVAVDNDTNDSIPGFAPAGGGAYAAGTSLNITAQTIPGYTFVMWSDEETEMSRQITLNESLVLEARYTHDQYTIMFLDADNEAISTQTCFYGDSIVVPDDPEKEGDAQYSYTFAGWNPTVPPTATGSQTFTPIFNDNINMYEITFLDRDEETVLEVDTLEFGAMPQYNGAPLENDTIDGIVYTWVGWTPELHNVADAETYVANYSETIMTFTVTIIIGDEQPSVQEVDWGTTIVLEAPDTSDEHFIRWSDGSEESYRQVTITSDSTFIAEFGASFVDIDIQPGQWNFVCLPQAKSGDFVWNEESLLTSELDDVVWGTYNGDVRAQAQSGWEKEEEEFNALQGYILWSSKEGRLRLNIYPENLNTEQVSISLNQHSAEFEQNADWNFVGNPLLKQIVATDILIGGLSAEATAHIFNGTGYDTPLLTSDEFVVAPLQAFFVQGNGVITFGNSGMNGNDPSGNDPQPAPARAKAQVDDNSRIDIQATAGGYTDKTRILFRSNSSIKYEAGRDASKFITATAPVQMYVLDVDNIECAQMVRPAGEDNIRLGYMLREAGEMEINMPIYADIYELYDNLTGKSYDLSETITISSQKGTTNNRLELRPIRNLTTGVENTAAAVSATKVMINGQLFLIREGKMFTVQGQEVK